MRTGAGKARSNVFFGDLCPSTRKRSLKTIAAKFKQRENWVNLLPIKECKNPLQKRKEKKDKETFTFSPPQTVKGQTRKLDEIMTGGNLSD